VHFVPQGPDGNPPPPGGRPPKKPEVFYQALEIIPLTQKDKQAKEDKPEN